MMRRLGETLPGVLRALADEIEKRADAIGEEDQSRPQPVSAKGQSTDRSESCSRLDTARPYAPDPGAAVSGRL